METTSCTCTDPAVACPSCLAKRDMHGFPKAWRERMSRTTDCTGCGHRKGDHYGWCTPELIEEGRKADAR